jgi:hypothetical protein
MENNGSTITQQTGSVIDQVSQGAKLAADRTNEFVQSGARKVGRGIQSKIKDLDVGTNTVPDAFRGAPKFISPTVHAWLDAAVTTYFLGLGAWYAMRGKRRPAKAAFVNAGMVAGVSMLTDYHGTGNKPISFKLHGTLDAIQATTAGLGPKLHGFSGKPAATFFYAQAVNELAVIACTDWDAGMPDRLRP